MFIVDVFIVVMRRSSNNDIFSNPFDFIKMLIRITLIN